MTHLKSLTTIILLALSLTTFGQTNLPTEKNIRQTFEKVFKEDKESGYKWSRWSACNIDSSFYKNDTVNLISDESYYTNSKCCKTVDLTFSSIREFTLQNVQGCKLISTITVSKGSNHFKLSFSTNGQFAIIIFTKNISKEQMKFKVISMDKVTSDYKNLTAIKLVRIK